MTRVICIISVCKKITEQGSHLLYFFPLRNVLLGYVVKGLWIKDPEMDHDVFCLNEEYLLKVQSSFLEMDSGILYGMSLYSKNLKNLSVHF